MIIRCFERCLILTIIPADTYTESRSRFDLLFIERTEVIRDRRQRTILFLRIVIDAGTRDIHDDITDCGPQFFVDIRFYGDFGVIYIIHRHMVFFSSHINHKFSLLLFVFLVRTSIETSNIFRICHQRASIGETQWSRSLSTAVGSTNGTPSGFMFSHPPDG